MNIYLSIGIVFAVVMLGIVALWLPQIVQAFRRQKPQPPSGRVAILERLLESQPAGDAGRPPVHVPDLASPSGIVWATPKKVIEA